MAEKLGITIDFKGDATNFDETVNGIEKKLRKLGTECRTLQQDLKVDPSNWDVQQKLIATNNERIIELKKQIELYETEMDKLRESGSEWTKDQKAQYDSLEKSMLRARKQLKKIEEANDSLIKGSTVAGKWAKEFENCSKQIENLSDNLNKAAKQFAVFSAAAAAGITAGVNYNAEMEQYTIALTTALGSEEKALETINQIKQDAQKTPWGVKELVEYNRTLIATGLSAEESEDIILSLGDAISAVGGSSDVFSRMVSNLQQIKNAGNATAMDIRQFAYAGIDIYGILSDYLGKTTDQITEQDRTWENIIGAFKKASSVGGKYFGAMENQSESLTAQLSKLKDEVSQALGEITESLMPTIKKIVAKIKEFAQWLKNLDDKWQNTIAKILVFTASLAPLLKGLSMVTKTLSSLTGGIGSVLKAMSGGTGLIAALATNFPAALAVAGVSIAGFLAYTALTKDNLVGVKEKLEDLQEEANGKFSESLVNIAKEQTNVNNCLSDVKTLLGQLDYNPDGTIDKTSDSYAKLSEKINEYHGYIGDSDTSIDEEIEKLSNNITTVEELAESYRTARIEKERNAWLEANQEAYDTALADRNTLLKQQSELLAQINQAGKSFAEDTRNTYTNDTINEYINAVLSATTMTDELNEKAQSIGFLNGGDDLNNLLAQYKGLQTEIDNTTQTINNYTRVATEDAETVKAVMVQVGQEGYTSMSNSIADAITETKNAIDETERYLWQLKQDSIQNGIDNSTEIQATKDTLASLWQQLLELQQDEASSSQIATEKQQDHKTAVDESKTSVDELSGSMETNQDRFIKAGESVQDYVDRINSIPSSVDTYVYTHYVDVGSSSGGGATKTTKSGGFGDSGGFSGGLNTLVNLANLVKKISIPSYDLSNAEKGIKNGLKLLQPKLASGGFNAGGFNFSINVNNNGNSISSYEVKQWAKVLTDQINENLGKEM